MAENIAEVLVAVQADVKNAVTEITNLKNDLVATVKAGKSFDSFFDKLDKTLARFNVITEGSTAELSDLVKGLTSTSSAVNNLTDRLGELAIRGGKNIATLATSSNSLEKSIRDAAAQANRFNTGNILAQIQDIGVTAAMNMNPMTIALQQGTQLLYVFQQSKAPIAEFVAALKSMFSPLSLLTIGLTGLVAAGIQMTDWVSVGKTALNGLASAFDWVAENSGTVAAAIGLITSALLTLNASAIATAASILVLKARILILNGLIAVMDGLTFAVKMMTNAWFLVPAVVIGAVEGFAYFKDNVKKILNSAIDYIINFVNKSIGYFKGLKEVITEIPNIVKTAWNDSASAANAKITEIMNKNMGEKYINADKIKESVNSVVDVAAQGVLKVNKTISNTVKSMSEAAFNGLKSMAKGLGENTKEAEKLEKALEKVTQAYEEAIISNREKIDSLRFDESLKGLTEEEKIVARINREYKNQIRTLEEKAQSENLNLKQFEKYKKQLEDQRIEQTELELQIYKDKEAQEAWNSAIDYSASLTKGFFSDLKSGLKEGQSAWEAFTNAVLKMLDKISDKMMDMAIDAMFDSMKQGGGNSTSWMSSAVNAIASVFTGGSTGPTNIVPEIAAGNTSASFAPDALMYTHYAKGGAFTNGIYNSPTMFKFAGGGKFGVMGEAGPEAVMPLHRSPDGSLGIRADGVEGGSPVVVNVINNSNARATTQQRQTEQGTTIDVMIDELVAQKLGKQGTASNQALTAFNNRQLIAR